MLKIVADEAAREELASSLDEIVREGARRMLHAALEVEVDSYLEAARGQRDEVGHALVVRNGTARPRPVTTAAGAIEVKAPRVNDKRVDPQTGERARFASTILPPYVRRSPKVAEVLPLLYLHGLSTGDFVLALEEFFGSAAGLSAPVIARLTKKWQDEQRDFMTRDLSDRDYVYVFVDGVHFNVRLGSSPCERCVFAASNRSPLTDDRHCLSSASDRGWVQAAHQSSGRSCAMRVMLSSRRA